jgi:hypothetical protein
VIIACTLGSIVGPFGAGALLGIVAGGFIEATRRGH